MGQCSNREVYGLDNEQRDQEIMSVIAYLYYYADMNQADIADRLFLSRSTVSRLIKKARQNGVVELRINEPWQRDLPLEDELKTAFGINGARVLKESPETDAEGLLVLLSRMTAYCISCSMQKHTIVGMSWGNTISHVCNAITTTQNIPMTVVPIMGTMTWPDPSPESMQLSQRFARVYGGRFFPLNAPLYAESREALYRLQQDPAIQEAMAISRSADVIITSVGSIESHSWAQRLGEDKLNRLKEIGCVGHIGGHFYDINGHEIDGQYKDLHIGLSMKEIQDNGNVVCVAASPRKAEAVFGAIHGGAINTLITTCSLAQRLLDIAGQRRV